jgi:hypothetical protein
LEYAIPLFSFPQCVIEQVVKLICSWLICSWNITNWSMANQEDFFRALGAKVRLLRKKRKYSQEDMISFGFSARHWQQVEAGRPITVTTLLRICEVFEISMAKLVRGLDAGIYEKLNIEPPSRKRR